METSVNNKCRAFTSLEQSRKLAEILPLESADMYYEWPNKKVHLKDDEYSGMGVSCWSLAALLSVLPSGYVIVKNYHSFYFAESRGHERSTNIFNNPVDACVEMIEKLHELNLL